MSFPFILYRYIGRQFLFYLFCVFLGMSFIIFTASLMELTRRAAHVPVSFATLAQMALLKIPYMSQKLLPFTVLFASMQTFWRMIKSHEIVIARASGVSIWQILTPILVIVFSLGVARALFISPFAAATYARYEVMNTRLFDAENSFMSLSNSGLWLRENEHEGYRYIHAEQISHDGNQLDHLAIIHMTKDHRFVSRLDAGSATLSPDGWKLQEVWQSLPGKPLSKEEDIIWHTDLSPKKIQESFAPPEAMSFWELAQFIDRLDKSGFSSTKHRIYWQSLVATPFLLMAMVLIAAAFSVRIRLRTGNILGTVILCLIAGFVWYLMSDVILALGTVGHVPIMMAAWMPAIVMLMLGIAALFHFEDG